MRQGRVLRAAVLLAAMGCGGSGDSGTNPPAETRGAISGSVRNGAAGVANVTVALSGGATGTTTTSGTGSYAFGDLAPGAYTVTITVPAGLQLVAGQAASRAVTVVAGQTASADFALEAPAVVPGAIAGAVRSGNDGVAGATLTLTGNGVNRATTSAANGGYTLSAVAPGAYALALTVPSGFALAAGETASRAVTVTSAQTATVDFALVVQAPATEIDVAGFTFAPADVTVAVGTRVRWVNGSALLHTVTPDGHSEWANADLAAGTSFEHVFDAAGTYAYFCTPHRDAGMTGVIRVQ